MATTTEVRKVVGGLDEDDRQRVLKYARKLSGTGPGETGAESLSKSNAPSYLAMADQRTYDIKRQKVEKNQIPDPR